MLKCWSSLNGGGIFQIHRSLSRFDSRWPPMICDALTNYDLFVFNRVFCRKMAQFSSYFKISSAPSIIFSTHTWKGCVITEKEID